jgi:glycosyltransferase involved in cell wall biosynthesis
MTFHEIVDTNEFQHQPPLQAKNIVICIPAYNEAQHIADIVQKAKKFGTEVIVYDDGSDDDTSNIAKGSGAVTIRDPVNRGYGAAIGALFQTAKSRSADIMITLDSDGQHDPDQIPQLLEPILTNSSDIVIGSRFLEQGDARKVPRYRSFGIKAITKVACVGSYSNITDAQSGFRAYNKRALARMDLFEEGMEVSTEILLKAKEKNLRIAEVPITIKYNSGRTSTQNPIIHGMKVLAHVLQFISLRHPLLFYGLPGLGLLITSAFFIHDVLDLFSRTRFISTNMILVSVGLAVVGAIFLATGAIVYTLVALFKGKLKEL